VPLRPPKHPGRVAIVAIGLLVVFNLAWLGYRSQDTSTAADDRPEAVVLVTPSEDAAVGPRDVIGADLRDTFTGALNLNGARIPEDQYEGDAATGQIFWRPGEGQELETLPEGRNEVTVVYWRAGRTEAEAEAAGEISSYTWRFEVGF
jgi:hypothetical protein